MYVLNIRCIRNNVSRYACALPENGIEYVPKIIWSINVCFLYQLYAIKIEWAFDETKTRYTSKTTRSPTTSQNCTHLCFWSFCRKIKYEFQVRSTFLVVFFLIYCETHFCVDSSYSNDCARVITREIINRFLSYHQIINIYSIHRK